MNDLVNGIGFTVIGFLVGLYVGLLFVPEQPEQAPSVSVSVSVGDAATVEASRLQAGEP